jgi:N utilization substance protein A
MMNINNLIEQLCADHGVSEEFVLDVLLEGIKQAWAYDAGDGYDIGISIQKSKYGDVFKCFRKLTVVDKVTIPQKEISEDSAHNLNPLYKIGDVIEDTISLNKLSRSAITIVDNHIKNNIQLRKKQNEFEFFSPKVGTIIMCTVTAISPNGQGIIVSIHGFEGLITDYNFMKSEYAPGSRIKAYLYKVEENYEGFQVFLSRNNEEFLIEILKEEVPEIRNGVVKVINVARNPGFASIVLVKSEDPQNKISEVGVCIGSGGNRIKNVQKELRGEKIYILAWKEMLFTRIAMVISCRGKVPIQKIIVHDDNEDGALNYIEVVVPQEFVSKIIGPKGRNIDLISRALNEKIKITSYNEQTNKNSGKILNEEEKTENLKNLKDLLNLTDEETMVLENMGLTTIDALRIPFQEFLNIPFPHKNHGVIYNRVLENMEPLAKKDEPLQNIEKKSYNQNYDDEEENEEY